MVTAGDTLSPAEKEAVEKLRAELPVWQRDIPMVVLAANETGWSGRAMRGEREAEVLYDAALGWRWRGSLR